MLRTVAKKEVVLLLVGNMINFDYKCCMLSRWSFVIGQREKSIPLQFISSVFQPITNKTQTQNPKVMPLGSWWAQTPNNKKISLKYKYFVGPLAGIQHWKLHASWVRKAKVPSSNFRRGYPFWFLAVAQCKIRNVCKLLKFHELSPKLSRNFWVESDAILYYYCTNILQGTYYKVKCFSIKMDISYNQFVLLSLF